MLALAVLLAVLASDDLGSVQQLASRSVVLTYHDMVPVRNSKALWFDCTPAEFEQQLDAMSKRGAHFVSLKQLYRHLMLGDALPKKAVAITFADSYLGFYRYALPILRRRHVSVAQFVHTDFVGSSQGRPKMSWAQLKELDKEGLVTICSQTRTHPEDLRRLPDVRLMDEFSGSKRALEQHLGHPVDFVAYPNGKFDRRVAFYAKRAGYRLAFTEEQRPAELARNPFMVPRYVHTKWRVAGTANR